MKRPPHHLPSSSREDKSSVLSASKAFSGTIAQSAAPLSWSVRGELSEKANWIVSSEERLRLILAHASCGAPAAVEAKPLRQARNLSGSAMTLPTIPAPPISCLTSRRTVSRQHGIRLGKVNADANASRKASTSRVLRAGMQPSHIFSSTVLVQPEPKSVLPTAHPQKAHPLTSTHPLQTPCASIDSGFMRNSPLQGVMETREYGRANERSRDAGGLKPPPQVLLNPKGMPLNLDPVRISRSRDSNGAASSKDDNPVVLQKRQSREEHSSTKTTLGCLVSKVTTRERISTAESTSDKNSSSLGMLRTAPSAVERHFVGYGVATSSTTSSTSHSVRLPSAIRSAPLAVTTLEEKRQPESNTNDSLSKSTEQPESIEEKRARIDHAILDHYSGLHVRREAAACVIQRGWRCSRARLLLFKLRQILYQHVYIWQRAAAQCIIGFLRSVILQRKRREESERRRVNDIARAEAERQMALSVRCIERVVWRWLRRKREDKRLCAQYGLLRDECLRQFESATRRIQKWWPRAVVQRAYWAQRRARLEEEERRRLEEARLNSAATQIQRVVRGVLGRQYARVEKIKRAREESERRQKQTQCTDLLIAVLQEYAKRLERLRREEALGVVQAEEAAHMIQAAWRAGVERRRFEQAVSLARRLRMAAECIQRAWRRFYAGRDRRYLRELQRTLQQERVDSEYRIYRATLRLQGFARAILAKAAARRRRAEVGRAVLAALLLLQRVGRGGRVRWALQQHRLTVLEERAQQTAALAVFQDGCANVVQGFALARHSCGLVERRRRAKYLDTMELRAIVLAELQREASAVRIQRALRRWWRKGAAAAVQREEALAREWLLRAVIRLQAWWRGRLAAEAMAYRQAQVAQLMCKRLELEEVHILLAQEAKERGERHLFRYHEAGRCADRSRYCPYHDEPLLTQDEALATTYEDDSDDHTGEMEYNVQGLNND